MLQPCVLEVNFSGDDSVFLHDDNVVTALVEDEAALLDAPIDTSRCSTEILDSKQSLYESIVNSSFDSIELVRLIDPPIAAYSDGTTLLRHHGSSGWSAWLNEDVVTPPGGRLSPSEGLSPSIPDRQPWAAIDIAGRKRQFIDVEKSPVGRPVLAKAMTGLTLDIQALSVEQPAKRALREIQNEIVSRGTNNIGSGAMCASPTGNRGRLVSYAMSSSRSRIDGCGLLRAHVDLASYSSSGGEEQPAVPFAAATIMPPHQRKQTHYMTLPSSSSDDQKSSKSSAGTTSSPASSMADGGRLHFVVSWHVTI